MALPFDEIRRGLDELRSAPVRPANHYAKYHRKPLNPPLTEEDITEFETKHRIALPADYRAFLIHVGNGGPGPYCGVFKLGEMDDGWEFAPWKENDFFVGTLSAPFPHTGPWNDLTGQPADDGSDEAEYERRMVDFDKRYYDPANVNGAIPICHLGCALRQWLVVTGPEAGHIWCDDRSDYEGLYPLRQGNMSRVSFIEWYCDWLNDALRELREGERGGI